MARVRARGVESGLPVDPFTRRFAPLFQAACICILMAGLVSQAAEAQSRTCSEQPEHKVTFGTRAKIEGVQNFGKVTDTLYRGAQPTKDGFASLSKLGINIVVDLRGSTGEREVVTKLGMKYVPLPWHCFNPKDEQFAKFLTLVRENPGQKIFVHCRLGDDRTGMEIAAYRMAEQGWTAQDARKEMVAFGANWFHRRICPGLGSYEREFPERFKKNPAFKSLRSDHTGAQAKP